MWKCICTIYDYVKAYENFKNQFGIEEKGATGSGEASKSSGSSSSSTSSGNTSPENRPTPPPGRPTAKPTSTPGDGIDPQLKDLEVTITNKGKEVTFTNQSGKEVHTVEHNPKNIPTAIQSALKSSEKGKRVEGNVAAYVVEQGKEITGFGQKFENVADGRQAGEIDIGTHAQLIEVKATVGDVDIKQIRRFADPTDPNYINYEGKEVILYINEPMVNLSPNYIMELEKIRDLNITIVNSLEELGEVLK